MNRRTRDRKVLGIVAAFVAMIIASYMVARLFTINGWTARILAFVVIAVVGATVYTLVFNGPEAFWNMVRGRQKETQ